MAPKDCFRRPNFLCTPAASPAIHAIDRFVLLRVLFFCFSVSADLCSGVLPLLSVAGFSVSVTESCDEEVGVDDVEKLVDKPGTTDGTLFDFLAIFGEMWFLTAGPMVGLPMIIAEFPE